MKAAGDKIIVFAIFVLLSCSLASAGSYDKFKPKFYEDYESRGGLLDDFGHSLNPFDTSKYIPEGGDNADIYGWYNGTFFGLAAWELEACLVDLSPETENIKSDASLSEDSDAFYVTTISLASKKMISYDEKFYFEVSWYIMPYGTDILYKVYLKKGSSKLYIVGEQGSGDDSYVEVSKYVGDAGYELKEDITVEYNEAVLEYIDLDSGTTHDEFIVPVT
ncbi:MAG: hypothetical protein V1866_07470 [archaeon]